MSALLENLDAFTTSATMAQVLPVLHGRSYLDIPSMHCQEGPGRSQGSVGRQGKLGWGWRRCRCGGSLVSISATVASRRHADAHRP